MQARAAIIAAFSAIWLSGCSFSGLMGGSAPITFDLVAPPVAKVRGARDLQLTINSPTAIRTIDTEEVLVKSPGGRVSYYSGVAWADKLPRLFQARLAETFANTGGFRAILTSQDRVTGDLSLSLEIRDFEVEAGGGRPEAVVDVYAKLVSERENTVVATKRFQERVQAESPDVGSGVAALNGAFQKVAADIVAWVSRSRHGQS